MRLSPNPDWYTPQADPDPPDTLPETCSNCGAELTGLVHYETVEDDWRPRLVFWLDCPRCRHMEVVK